ncbi:MAG: type 2 isopentenyl-diphosphate Delta-isomerase [Nitrososphaerota archaeon]
MTETRKADHIRICLSQDVQARRVTTGLEDVHLIHRALPEVARDDVELQTTLLNHSLSAPLVIEAMTGGTSEAAQINAALAEAAEQLGLAMGVGSQRAALETPALSYTDRVARDRAPSAFLMANLGLAQILEENWKDKVEKAIDMIEADAICIHLNALQEAVQVGGNTNFVGAIERLREVAEFLSVPVIVKETGAGISYEVAKALEKAKVAGIDISGAGGTSWAAVESHRQQEIHLGLGHTFWDWGIPTAVSTFEAASSTHLTIISSGGIRTGIDVAKTIALGASAAGLALPLLRPAVEGRLHEILQGLIEELRTCMFLVGSRTVEDLKRSPLVITGLTAEWLRYRGFKVEEYACRGMYR